MGKKMEENQLAQGENRVIMDGESIMKTINLNKAGTPNDDEKNNQNADLVTGTEADLRRLHLSEAKKILQNHGVPDEKIRKLKRWEVIDVVRQIATTVSREKRGDKGIMNFSR